MKKIKILLFLLPGSLFFTSLKAQNDTLGEKKTCDGYMSATYIFEGKLDSSKYFTVKTGEYTYDNYNAYLVEVTKVIKGNIQKGTIEILQPAEGYTYKGPDHASSFQQSEPIDGAPAQGVYLCWDKNQYMTHSCYANSNNKTLSLFDGIPVTSGKIPKDPRGGISFYFSTLPDFYSYVSANYEITIDK